MKFKIQRTMVIELDIEAESGWRALEKAEAQAVKDEDYEVYHLPRCIVCDDCNDVPNPDPKCEACLAAGLEDQNALINIIKIQSDLFDRCHITETQYLENLRRELSE